mmetsp:Transcript_31099/g.93264  ORF Transcript_31099/g.93264 Transcript_31099/m.93264 type:complete len:250 (+) Transcript_31099:1406-2155(+)
MRNQTRIVSVSPIPQSWESDWTSLRSSPRRGPSPAARPGMASRRGSSARRGSGSRRARPSRHRRPAAPATLSSTARGSWPAAGRPRCSRRRPPRGPEGGAAAAPRSATLAWTDAGPSRGPRRCRAPLVVRRRPPLPPRKNQEPPRPPRRQAGLATLRSSSSSTIPAHSLGRRPPAASPFSPPAGTSRGRGQSRRRPGGGCPPSPCDRTSRGRAQSRRPPSGGRPPARSCGTSRGRGRGRRPRRRCRSGC